MTPDIKRTSSLLFGIQWDLVCRYLDGKDGLTTEDINLTSKEWGNYSDNRIVITSTNAKSCDVWFGNGKWEEIAKDEIKPEDDEIVLSTGASTQTKKMNIYDFAGNVDELTLEKVKEKSNSSSCAMRGGFDNLSDASAAYRDRGSTRYCSSETGFRATLY